MGALASLKQISKRPRLCKIGDTYSRTMLNMRKPVFKSKAMPHVSCSDKRGIFMDIMSSVDCSSIEGSADATNDKHLRSIKSVNGYLPLSWDVLDWQTWAELFHGTGSTHVIDYSGCIWVAQGHLQLL